MPVTHLNNYLDVTSGGPAYFLEQNLLAFPQPMNVSAVFGSAVDKALTEAVRYPRYNAGEVAPLDRLISVFKKELAKARLPKNESKKQIDKGEEVLLNYMKQRKGYFNIEDESQVDFRNEGVVIEGAPLTGKIDLLKIEGGECEVIDFKTGDATKSFESKGSDPYEKIKLHKYKQQLMYYKLLIENSSRKSIPIKLLALEFVEGDEKGKIIQLALTPSDEEIERLKKLIGIVYSKIMNLDFPDTSKYKETLDGILQFEDDLLNGVV
jgi:DNA helicase-2/ATP-dependent DNA helicase PcrA